jgi:hypothetical protein
MGKENNAWVQLRRYQQNLTSFCTGRNKKEKNDNKRGRNKGEKLF